MWMVPRCWRPGSRPGRARKFGHLAQGDVDLEARARVVDGAHGVEELGGQDLGLGEPEEGHAGIAAGDDDGRGNLGAVGEGHSPRAAVLHEDARHLGVHADLGAALAGGRGQRVADPAHSAADVAPHAPGAVALAHDVVEQHVGRPRHRRRRLGPDDRVGGQGGLELVRLEPAVEEGAAAPVMISMARGPSRPEPEKAQAEPAQGQQVAGASATRDRAASSGAWAR